MKIFFLLAIGALFLAAPACKDDPKQDFYLNYFQNALDAQFPAGTRLVDCYDSKQSWVVGVFKLPQGDLGTFITSLHFEAIAEAHKFNGLDKLKQAYRELPPANRQVFREGRGWQAVIDREKGLMWVQIIYSEKADDVGF